MEVIRTAEAYAAEPFGVRPFAPPLEVPPAARADS